MNENFLGKDALDILLDPIGRFSIQYCINAINL